MATDRAGKRHLSDGAQPQLVFAFDHPHSSNSDDLRHLLGGKGAGLACLSGELALPVPPGFTISTAASKQFADHGWTSELESQVEQALARLESMTGRTFGAAENSLLVSVRSGAAVSMPGMMDTILNVGLTAEIAAALAEQTADPMFAWSSYSRLLTMYGRSVLGIEHLPDAVDSGQIGAIKEAISQSETIIAEAGEARILQDVRLQLRHAIEAVFKSWWAPRAQAYRQHDGISDDLGTAVNVQVMVFGNRDDNSGTGVAFSRDPSTGDNVPFGDFLIRAQGEDVVSGSHRTLPLAGMSSAFPMLYGELNAAMRKLEGYLRDAVDVEFTIEQGRLWILQFRSAKRAPLAALRMAVQMVDDPVIGLTREQALLRVKPEQLRQLAELQAAIAPPEPAAKGLGACPGVVSGRPYCNIEAALDAADRGEPVILVREETSPDDIQAMSVAEGILTSKGGLVSHAAVVARAWNKPAVVGAEQVVVSHDDQITIAGQLADCAATISIDGSSGHVFWGDVERASAIEMPELATFLTWARAVSGVHGEVLHPEVLLSRAQHRILEGN